MLIKQSRLIFIFLFSFLFLFNYSVNQAQAQERCTSAEGGRTTFGYYPYVEDISIDRNGYCRALGTYNRGNWIGNNINGECTNSNQGLTCSASSQCGAYVSHKIKEYSSGEPCTWRWVGGISEDDACRCRASCSPDWGNWINDSCGENPPGNLNCNSNQRLQHRNDGCGDTQYRCRTDSYTNEWTNDQCGGANRPCNADQMHQTRNSVYNCLDESRCVTDNTCGRGAIGGKIIKPDGGNYQGNAFVVRKPNSASNFNENDRDQSDNQSNYRFNDLPGNSIHDLRLASSGDSFNFNNTNKIDSCVYTTNDNDGTPWIKENVQVENNNANFRLELNNYAIRGKLWWDPDGSDGGGDRQPYVNQGSIPGKSVRVRVTGQGNDLTDGSLNPGNANAGRYGIGGLRTDTNGINYTVTVDTAGTDGIRPAHRVIGGNSRTVTVNCGDVPNIDFNIGPNVINYNINGIVYLDSDGSRTVSAGDARYTRAGTISIDTTSRSDNPSPTDGTYSIVGNPNGTYTIRMTGLALGYSVISTNPRNVTVSGLDANNVNFLVSPPVIPPTTWDISGTVYLDDNENNTLDGTDPLFTGNIRITATNTGTSATTVDNALDSGSNYSIPNVANGTYRLNVSNLDTVTGFTVINAPNATHPRNNLVVNGANRPGQNFLIAGPSNTTYSIIGGVFSASAANDFQKNGTEAYINSNLIISSNDGFAGFPRPLTSNSSGFSISNLTGGTYTITYPTANIPSGYFPTYPAGTPPSVTIIVGPGCSTGTHTFAQCNSNNITGLNFGIFSPPFEQWIQSVGGDIRIDIPNYTNVVSSANGATPICSNTSYPYFSSNSISNALSPGIVFTGTSPTFEGSNNPRAKANPSGWLITGNRFTPSKPGTIRTSYAYLKNALTRGRVTQTHLSTVCAGGLSNCALRPGFTKGVYYTDANQHVTLTGAPVTVPVGNTVFLIDGNLTINTNIDIPIGSTATFIVKGNIIVNQNVNQIEGVYSADGNFTFSGGTITPLVVEGNLIANAGLGSSAFINSRNLGSTQNAECPSVRVVSRPDFILNGPELLRYTNYVIQEIAPGAEHFN